MTNRTLALLTALADGVTAHLTLMARCGLHQAYSEYLLYDPVVRIALHLGWDVKSEKDLPKRRQGRGDFPRIDFLMTFPADRIEVALELKWPRDPRTKLNAVKDIEKLLRVEASQDRDIDARVLLVAGPHDVTDPREPKLRVRSEDPRLIVRLARGLGQGKRGWGTTIFVVAPARAARA